MARHYPTVGNWFHEAETNLNFEIVAVDENGGTVEIQYESGEVSRFELESWGRLNITPVTSNEMGIDPAYNDDIRDDFTAPMDEDFIYHNMINGFNINSFEDFDDIIDNL